MSEIPTAYLIDLYAPSLLTLRYEPDRFGEAWALFEVLEGVEQETDGWLRVGWSTEY